MGLSILNGLLFAPDASKRYLTGPISLAANVSPQIAKILVEMRNDFEGRLERIEAGLTRIAIEAEKVQKLWEQEKEA